MGKVEDIILIILIIISAISVLAFLIGLFWYGTNTKSSIPQTIMIVSFIAFAFSLFLMPVFVVEDKPPAEPLEKVRRYY